MKKLMIVFMVFVFLSIASVAFAHPPSDIKITFDAKTKMLTAVIMHNTSNPVNHYISKVDVGLNGREIISHVISREDNNESQTVAYFIPDVKDKDVISVEGYCSISGKLEKEITVNL